MELADEIVVKRNSKFTRLARSSFSQLWKDENITSIGQKMINVEDLIRELILSEYINLDENKIQIVVENELSSFDMIICGNMPEKKVLEKSLRGYLSLINELLFKRFFLLKKIQEAFDKNIQILSRRLTKGDDREEHNRKEYILSCFDLIKVENLEKLDQVIEYKREETFLRSQRLLKIFQMEWEVIGEMKKKLEKLVDNCRICEKKVKVPDLKDHSKNCEKRFRLKDEIHELSKEFIEKVENFKELVKEKLKQEEQANIGSM